MNMTNCQIICNRAIGGAGQNSPSSGVQGGFAFGGGIDTSNNGSVAIIKDSIITGNTATGGAGASGSVGGNGYGGGLGVGWGRLVGLSPDDSSLDLIDSVLSGNFALGGKGGSGANGGNGLGGGLFIGPTAAASLTDSQITSNSEIGGAAGAGGSAGEGIGGGVYNDLGTLNEDLLTLIAMNFASTSNDNVYP